MKGDFTRDTFDPSKHFSKVLMQQGRVQVDADWNEQTSILLHYLRTLAKDILGPHAGPASDLGFEIITKDTSKLDDKLKTIEPVDEDRRKALQEALKNGDLAIGPGRYYVEGVLVDNDRAVLYSQHSGLSVQQIATMLDAPRRGKKGLLVYLDVWERHITYLEDDHIREVALGGPDTCTRAQVVWQVKVLLEPAGTAGFKCDAVADLAPLGTGRLRARARLDKPPVELCVIPPESRYRGAENQLYRVEVHRGGKATGTKTGATFKWSRENGSVTFPIRSLSGGTAILEHLGRDLHLSLKPGDWVEVIDDVIAVGEQAGSIAQVDTVDRDELSVGLKLPDDASPLPSYREADMATGHPLLRRWDHPGDPKAFGGALPIKGQPADADRRSKAVWIDLEDGVQIWFGTDGDYRAGDYWLIPARTATGDVDWPDELGTDGKPIAAALQPQGPRHYYAPLFLFGPGSEAGEDCRCPIEPLLCKNTRVRP